MCYWPDEASGRLVDTRHPHLWAAQCFGSGPVGMPLQYWLAVRFWIPNDISVFRMGSSNQTLKLSDWALTCEVGIRPLSQPTPCRSIRRPCLHGNICEHLTVTSVMITPEGQQRYQQGRFPTKVQRRCSLAEVATSALLLMFSSPSMEGYGGSWGGFVPCAFTGMLLVFGLNLLGFYGNGFHMIYDHSPPTIMTYPATSSCAVYQGWGSCQGPLQEGPVSRGLCRVDVHCWYRSMFGFVGFVCRGRIYAEHILKLDWFLYSDLSHLTESWMFCVRESSDVLFRTGSFWAIAHEERWRRKHQKAWGPGLIHGLLFETHLDQCERMRKDFHEKTQLILQSHSPSL